MVGKISASLAFLSRTIDDYADLAKKELIQAKQEKAYERIKTFRGELGEYRERFAELRRQGEETVRVPCATDSSTGQRPLSIQLTQNNDQQSSQNRNELLGRRPHHTATPENPYAQASLAQNSAFAPSKPQGLSFGASPQDATRESHALREQSFMQSTNAALDEYLERGRAVLGDLGQQHEMLKGTQKRLYTVGTTLGISGDTIRMVERRAKEDKWIFWGGVVVFFLFCWLVIHYLR